MRVIILFFVLLVLCFGPSALAQDACPAAITSALELVDTTCDATGRNQVCYGNLRVNATPREGSAGLQFDKVGDIIDVADVETLRLSGARLSEAEWGVALMKLQANLPDTLPGQNVTLLLLGDVSMTDASDQTVEVPVTAISGVNVRALPSTDAAVIDSLHDGQEVAALGRLPDGSWVRVRLESAAVGWVSADFLTGDLQRLLLTEPGAAGFGPMQAFYFTSGFADAPCESAPASGILIQTPAGAGAIQLRANDVDIRLGSTVYLQAVPDDALYVNVIEGHATLTAFGESQMVLPGTVAAVPLDASGVASGPPAYPQTYDQAALQALPVEEALPAPISVEPGIPEAEIPAALDVAEGLPPNGGRWLHTEIITNRGCPGPEATFQVGDVMTFHPIITFNEDRTIVMVPLPETVTYYRSGASSYVGHYNGANWTITFTSPTTYVGSLTSWPGNPECSFDTTYSGVYQP